MSSLCWFFLYPIDSSYGSGVGRKSSLSLQRLGTFFMQFVHRVVTHQSIGSRIVTSGETRTKLTRLTRTEHTHSSTKHWHVCTDTDGDIYSLWTDRLPQGLKGIWRGVLYSYPWNVCVLASFQWPWLSSGTLGLLYASLPNSEKCYGWNCIWTMKMLNSICILIKV